MVERLVEAPKRRHGRVCHHRLDDSVRRAAVCVEHDGSQRHVSHDKQRVVLIDRRNDVIRTGSFKDGPWSFRIVSLVVMMPVYSCLLVTVGTVFGFVDLFCSAFCVS